MARIVFPALAVLTVLSCSGAEPFQLQLTSLSEAWFPGGAVVKVPPDKCSELQVRLSKPWSAETRIEGVELKLDDVYPRFQRLIGAEGYLFDVITREPVGLLTREAHHIEAVTTGKHVLSADWTVMRWEKAYVEAVAAGSGGLPIGIQLDSPAGVVLVGRGGTVRFRGKLSGVEDARLTINGQNIARIASKPGYQFDQQVGISPGAREVIVKGDDSAGDATILALRIQN